MDYLPLFFDLKGRLALLVGGGEVALRKARLLSRAGARLRLVAHEVQPELRELIEEGQGQVIIGEYHPALLEEATLVVAATSDARLNERVHHDALARSLPVNVVDCPALCTFVFPAIVDRSPIMIGISSGGQSPVLARLLRARLETLIPNGYGRLGRLVGAFRERVKARFSSVNQRRNFWEGILQGEVAERVFAGREEEARALLEDALEQADDKRTLGEVYLVGAGPGDPELLTFKALRLMQQADVVLYDRLVSPEVLDLCRRDAQLIYVGKARDNHSLPQQGINELLVEQARKGHRVVRLKGGDPFIFGRGGEEIEALKAQGIPFQVVPGITAASACSTHAGIPLTHRDYAQSVKFVTGQLKNRTSELNFAELVHPNQTIVFYMGLHTLEELCSGLMGHGKPGSTPVAIISRGSSAQQRVLVGQLDDIVARQREAQLPGPAILIVGEVVALHSRLAWFGQPAEASTSA